MTRTWWWGPALGSLVLVASCSSSSSPLDNTGGGGAGSDGGVGDDGGGPTVDTSCVDMHMLEARPVEPSAVALFLSVDNCAGEPVTNLDPSRFVISEDGQPISVEASVTPIPLKGQEIFVDLLIDASTSTAAYQAQLLAAASQFVDTVTASGAHVQIGVSAFAGDPGADSLLDPNLDAATVKNAIASIATYKPSDANSTNLYGAVTNQLASLEGSAANFRDRNYGGAFTADYLIVFTAGRDTSDRATLADTVAAIAKTPATVLGVALNGPDYDSAAATAFQQLATGGVVTADPSTLTSTFEGLATKMAGQFKRTYLVGYCSPARATTPTVTVSLASPTVTQTAATATFDASDFGPGCSAAAFTNCGTAQCGGLGCGACDDETTQCVSMVTENQSGDADGGVTTTGTPGQCVSDCTIAGKCNGEVITNTEGYTQTCAATPTSVSCNSVCTNTTADPENCGICGKLCSAGETCFESVCTDGISADGGSGDDGGGTSAFIGTWTLVSGSGSLNCNNGMTEVLSLGPTLLITAGTQANTVVITSDNGNCVTIYDVSGDTATVAPGQTCTITSNGTVSETDTEGGTLTISGTTLTTTTADTDVLDEGGEKESCTVTGQGTYTKAGG